MNTLHGICQYFERSAIKYKEICNFESDVPFNSAKLHIFTDLTTLLNLDINLTTDWPRKHGALN